MKYGRVINGQVCVGVKMDGEFVWFPLDQWLTEVH